MQVTSSRNILSTSHSYNSPLTSFVDFLKLKERESMKDKKKCQDTAMNESLLEQHAGS